MVAPLENLTANALVASEGVSLLVVDLKGKGPGFDAVEEAVAEVDGLSDEIEVFAGALLLLLCSLAKRREPDVEEAGLKEAEPDLNGDSVSGLDESGTEEGLEVDSH